MLRHVTDPAEPSIAKCAADWSTFHDVFSEALGFPEYDGRNMDAWIDCLTHSDDPDAGMLSSGAVAGDGDVLTLQIDSAKSFAKRCPDQYGALIECAAFVNWRRIETNERAILALSFWQ